MQGKINGPGKRAGHLAQTGGLRSDVIVITIPPHETVNTVCDRRGGLKPDFSRQIVDVGEGCGHVARLHRQVILLGGASQSAFKRFNQGHQFHRLIVVHLVGVQESN